MKTLAKNRKAGFNYTIEEKILAGLSLLGSEVKSIRSGRVNLSGSYVSVDRGEIILKNALVPMNENSGASNHDPNRDRKLLITKAQIQKIISSQQNGRHIIPIEIVAKNGFIKLLIGIGRSKSNVDKRQHLKKRDTDREIAQRLKHN